jgi:uncharacterized membrane protein (UPF0136 family)
MANTILWVYIGLLIVGGLIGFFKAGSKISLISSVLFAVALTLFAAHVVDWALGPEVLLLLLLLVFVVRYSKGRKFMPAGLMVILTLAVLLFRYLIGGAP